MQEIPNEIVNHQKLYEDNMQIMINLTEADMTIPQDLLRKEKQLNNLGIKMRRKYHMYALDPCPMPYLKSCYRCSGKYIQAHGNYGFKALKKNEHPKKYLTCHYKIYFK